MKAGFVLNPLAGRSDFHRELKEAGRHLASLGWDVHFYETRKTGDATSLARRAAAEGCQVVVAVGGDGTINEVVNGLVGTETTLGVLPAGTANVFAIDVSIPVYRSFHPAALRKAAEIIHRGQRRRIDVGQVRFEDGRERYFLMWAGIGLDAAITGEVKAEDKRRLGKMAFVITGAMVAVDFMGTRATLTVDGGQKKKRILMAVASNGQLYGGVWRLAPEAKLDDGLLDVAVMEGYGFPSTLRHLIGVTLGRHVRDPDFHLYRTSRLRLEAKSPLPVHVDAEPVGHTPVDIRVVPQALTIIVPRNASERLFSRPGDSP
ncbi:MAG: diacylglycerol/lipid kinase family protein [Anaerolineae bacterium]